jgi:hypothetical protein
MNEQLVGHDDGVTESGVRRCADRPIGSRASAAVR